MEETCGVLFLLHKKENNNHILDCGHYIKLHVYIKNIENLPLFPRNIITFLFVIESVNVIQSGTFNKQVLHCYLKKKQNHEFRICFETFWGITQLYNYSNFPKDHDVFIYDEWEVSE